MRKILSLVLTLLMVFSVMPIVMVSAAEVTTYLDSSQVGITWAQKVWSSSLSNGTAGDYETDGFTKKLTGTRSGQGMIMVQFPTSVFNEANLLNIKIAMTAETKIETKSFTAFFYKQGQNAGFDQRSTANNSVHYKYGTYVTFSENTQRVFTITPEKYPGVFENKLSVFCICVGAQGNASAPVYVDYVTYTVDQLGEEYTVTVDGVEAAKVYDGKTFTVPTPAEGYHYTDGTTDYFGGEEITVTGNVDLVSEINTYDVTVDGVVADTVEHGGTFTVPTPATGYDYTDGTNTYVGGEEITVTAPVELTTVVKTTKVVYTMDEGKTIVGGIIYFGAGEYLDVDGNKKLAIKLKSDAYAYLVLPSDWASKPYYKPTAISYTIGKSSNDTATLAYKTLDLCSKLGDNNLPAGEIHSICTTSSMIYAPKTVNIDVTEDMYDCNYLTGKLYSGNWTEANPTYLYVDDFTIYYEYDFDYVAPTTYDVTIDGVKVATVEEGETFVLPAAPDGKQYVDGYTAGQEFVVTSELAFFTEDIPVVAPVVSVSTIAGAGVRFNEVTGLRFKATVDTAAVEEAIALGYTVTMGTLIAPADVIGSVDALTFEVDENNYLDVVTTGYYNEEAGVVAGTISNIREANWGRTFMARAYVKLTKDNETVIYYAQQENARSLKEVAISALDDETVVYNTAQLDLLDKWSKAQAWA